MTKKTFALLLETLKLNNKFRVFPMGIQPYHVSFHSYFPIYFHGEKLITLDLQQVKILEFYKFIYDIRKFNYSVSEIREIIKNKKLPKGDY